MCTWKILALATFSLFAAATARAQESTSDAETPPPRSQPPESEWFGGQILIADVLAVGVGVGTSAGMDNPAPLLLGWSLAAPVVHLAHGDGTGAAGSLALHVLAPIAGALVGAKAASCSTEDFCELGGAAAGLLVGAVVATTLDMVLLARVPRTDLVAAAAVKRPRRLLAMPTVAVDPSGSGFVLGLAGRI